MSVSHLRETLSLINQIANTCQGAQDLWIQIVCEYAAVKHNNWHD